MRILLGGIFLVISGILIGVSFSRDPSLGAPDFLLNLGTEIIGIVITVSIVEYLFERNKFEEKARHIAWEALHAIDHAVWVWQGGAREFNLDELNEILSLAQPSDPIPDFTQSLFLNLGSRADNTCRTNTKETKLLPDLYEGLTQLRDLSTIRDNNDPIATETVIEILRDSVSYLSKAVGTTFSVNQANGRSPHRSAEIGAQERRHYGASDK